MWWTKHISGIGHDMALVVAGMALVWENWWAVFALLFASIVLGALNRGIAEYEFSQSARSVTTR